MNETVMVDADFAFEEQPFAYLEPSTQDEISDIVMKSSSKNCDIDPLPTYLLKQVLEDVLPLITVIINGSLVESTVPLCFEKANVRPSPKKANLDKDMFTNYRPVSNLPSSSRFLQQLVANHLQCHLNTLRHQLKVTQSNVARSMKNLDVYFDKSLTMERQINEISSASYYHIRKIGHTRQHITTCAWK